jgi:hypothetical protein
LQDGVGNPGKKISRVNSPTWTHLYRRFIAALTDNVAQLMVTVARITFRLDSLIAFSGRVLPALRTRLS